MSISCRNGHLDIVEKILEKFPTEVERKTKNSNVPPIFISLRNEQDQISKYLISFGAANPIYWFIKVAILQAKGEFFEQNFDFSCKTLGRKLSFQTTIFI